MRVRCQHLPQKSYVGRRRENQNRTTTTSTTQEESALGRQASEARSGGTTSLPAGHSSEENRTTRAQPTKGRQRRLHNLSSTFVLSLIRGECGRCGARISSPIPPSAPCPLKYRDPYVESHTQRNTEWNSLYKHNCLASSRARGTDTERPSARKAEMDMPLMVVAAENSKEGKPGGMPRATMGGKKNTQPHTQR